MVQPLFHVYKSQLTLKSGLIAHLVFHLTGQVDPVYRKVPCGGCRAIQDYHFKDS